MKTPILLSALYSNISLTIPENFKDITIENVVALDSKKPNSMSFYNGGAVYLESLKSTQVAACILKEEHASLLPSNVIPVISENPYLAIARVVHQIYGSGEEVPQSFLDISTIKKTDSKYQNISERANISSDAKIGNNVTILACVYIGSGVEIADNSTIHANASLEHCTIGKGCIIRSGARIGTSGFGFVPNFQNGQHFPIPQISRVIL
jgi:UDP-3-O-[3-hydroxymyristoyl] glucosamine N-acyltransferase